MIATGKRPDIDSRNEVQHLCNKKMKNGSSNGTPTPHPLDQLEEIARGQGLDITDRKFAEYMDSIDPIGHLREDFSYPKMKDLPKSRCLLVLII